MLSALAPLIVRSILDRELRLESEFGYKLTFDSLPSEWMNGYALADMTKTWTRFGLPIKGLNYFTLGAVEDGVSSRFNPGSRLFQAWLGGYEFWHDETLSWKPKDYLKLAEADQKKWLSYYGVEQPKMDFSDPQEIRGVEISGIKGRLYSWSGLTQADIGPHSRSLRNRAVMDGMAYIINSLHPHLKVKGKNFIPPAKTEGGYEQVRIYGYVALMNISSKQKALLYTCMAGDDPRNWGEMEQLITKHMKLSAMNRGPNI